jgi:hypothetical protein
MHKIWHFWKICSRIAKYSKWHLVFKNKLFNVKKRENLSEKIIFWKFDCQLAICIEE